MAIQAGTKLGSYEVTSHIGSGGMGEVYQARDTKLDRNVAIKVLPEKLARDSERLARFQREARLLAALNHPNIAAVYGFEQSGDTHYLVMELVPGETLQERMAGRKPLAVEEALRIAQQIAEALEAAHGNEKGIIHRDLKPANVKVTPEGRVKVLDFGLAKVFSAETSSEDISNSPTLSALPTQQGTILGTAAYMSPEQARGQAVDKRTDIWAFGAVLYELLTGRQAFGCATFSDTVAAVLGREPDWAALPQTLPPVIERLLHRCLEKDSRRRLHDAADARIEIEDALRAPAPVYAAAAVPARDSRRIWMVSVSLALLALVLGGVVVATFIRRVPDGLPATRLSLSAPGQIIAQSAPAVSPDGRRVAFVAADVAGRPMLWVRELDSLEPRLLAGTEDAVHPFWSPDGRSIGFVAVRKLKRVDASGGAVITLAEPASRSGGTWSQNGLILFRPGAREWATVPAAGGAVKPIENKTVDWPSFLPDGQHFLFVAQDHQNSSDIYVGTLGSEEMKRLVTGAFGAVYSPPGYLLFLRGDTLMAQPFDTARLQLTGDPAPVAEGILSIPTSRRAAFSVSQTGVLAYTNASLLKTQLVWFDRSGQSFGAVGAPDLFSNELPQLSPDGKRIVIGRDRSGDEDIWTFDLSGGTRSRLTLSHGSDHAAIWSAQGRKIIFQSGDQPTRLMAKDVDPIGPETVVADLAPLASLYDLSHDGQYAIYSATGSSGHRDLWVLPLTGDRKPRLFLHNDVANAAQAQFSPNGRWVAYTSSESGRDEVYVVSFPKPTVKRQVSTDGGVQPRWRRDGRELFYVSTDRALMAVPILNQETLQVGSPQALFRTRLVAQGSQTTLFDTLYDVSADGQKFLMNVDPEDPGPAFTVVLNWIAGLRK